MSEKFIEKAHCVVMSNLSDENFGANSLALLLGLSTSQTLRKIKAATGKSVNKYIRDLRLKEAARLIQETELSLAEISYKVGFNSASYFSKTFSNYYGITPSEFKVRKISSEELDAIKPTHSLRSIITSKATLYIGILLLALLAGYFIINGITAKNHSLPNSIAVLPFKDLSQQDNQWFCDGVSENILHSLAQIKDVTVTSFTSSSTYRNSEKRIPEIAKELGVSYILEGSVVLHDNKTKIIVQLIDCNDNHIWSKEYSDDFENIIDIQNNVAQEVVSQFKTTLTPLDEQTLNAYPTKNMKAYALHLEGRLINDSRNFEDLEKNIKNNKKAIALDSNFVEAYAQVASTNLVVAINYELSGNTKYVKEAREYVNDALALDPNSARANAVKARLLLGNDWSESEKYFKKAIALNPNDSETRYWYADYFLKSENSDLKQALKQATIASRLSPFSPEIAARYAWLMVLNNKFDEAEAYLTAYGFVIPTDERFLISLHLGSRKNKDWHPLFDWAYTLIKSDPENAPMYYHYLAQGYNQIYIDKLKSMECAKKAYDLNDDFLYFYIYNLMINGFHDKAAEFLKSDVFKNLPEEGKRYYTWEYQYYTGNYEQAQNEIEKYPEVFKYSELSKTYAQLGDRTKLDSINKLYFVQGEHKYFYRAYVHAILKERDSMYYYLNKVRYSYYNPFTITNGTPEFEPYKNDPRYKALLKEFYIPIPEK